MKVKEAIRGRRSIRRFKKKDIHGSLLEDLKEAIVWAPSAGNLQSRNFVFVLNAEVKNGIADSAKGQDFIKEAPLVVVACIDYKKIEPYGERGTQLYAIQDAAAAVENLLLQAHESGLGSVWIGSFNEEKVASVLKLPGNLRPVAIIPVGYPDESPETPPRDMAKDSVRVIR